MGRFNRSKGKKKIWKFVYRSRFKKNPVNAEAVVPKRNQD